MLSRSRIAQICLAVLFVFTLVSKAAGPGTRTVWDFSTDKPEEPPKGFTVAKGMWRVVDDSGNRVLAQLAKSPGDTFNVVLIDATSYRDVGLSVRLKANEGERDQGGGVVWRAKDAKNYYIARFNPLENNFRLYKVVDGVRTMFRSADLALPAGWHTLCVKMTGTLMHCTIDGKAPLEFEDGTFAEMGKVGLWTKADARTFFDDLTVQSLESAP